MGNDIFKQIDTKPNFPRLERRLLKWWYGSGLVEDYLKRNSNASKRFSFLDGPITANNPMGVHHAWGRTLKDIFQRFHNLKGDAERFQNGFDCQGLWVEVEVEKGLGFKTKKDIEKYGVAKFVNQCKERVRKFAAIQTEQSKRLGYFMDWDNSYFTMSDENNYMIWHFLKKCHERSLLYKGRDSVPWCPRCGTAISQHEILQEEYQERQHESVYVKLKVKSEKLKVKKCHLLIWTTTPWTIPANVAVAVNQKLEYGLVDNAGSKYLVASKRAEAVFGKKVKVIEKFRGEKLLGLNYEAPFDDLSIVKRARKEKPKTFHRLIDGGELVTGEEGTGLLHVAPGAGKEDYQLSQQHDLAVIAPLQEDASYVSGMGQFSGKNAKDKPEIIINYLRNKQVLLKTEMVRHRYPICWRCKTELVWRVVDEWYIAMDKPSRLKIRNQTTKSLREQMINVARTINWIPGFGLERELDWLRNMDDWLISKKRYWGLALPIWECNQGHFTVIGSQEELKQKAVAGWNEFNGHTPHRPWIDKVKIKCSQCGKIASRIKEVGNPWLDAGIVPFSTLIDPTTGKVSYLDDKKYFRQWFPADLVTECFPGQFKNWFYALLAMSTVLENTNPFKNLLGNALVRDEKGEEMHKSKGNAIWFDEAAEKIGVDVMRWLYIRNDLEHNVNFGYKAADLVRRQFHLRLWNVYRYFITYGNEYKLKIKYQKLKTHIKYQKLNNVLDRWMVIRLSEVVNKVSGYLNDYQVHKAARSLEKFVEDLSTWYIRRSRERVAPYHEDIVDRDEFLKTLYDVLVVLTKLLAPLTPFLSEEMFKNLTQERSVHLQDWPVMDKLSKEDKELIKLMELVRQICKVGHSERKRTGIKLRQPLRKLKVKKTPRQGSVSFASQNEKLKRHLAKGSVSFAFSKIAIQKSKFKNELIKLIMNELNVKEVELVAQGKDLIVDIDTKITSQLKAEGEMRDIVRRIQRERQRLGLPLRAEISVELPRWPREFTDDIKRQTFASDLKQGEKFKITTQ